MFALLVLLINAALCLLAFYNFYYKRKNFPPGPTPLPFIGNSYTLRQYPPGEECYLKWMREYGPVYSESIKLIH